MNRYDTQQELKLAKARAIVLEANTTTLKAALELCRHELHLARRELVLVKISLRALEKANGIQPLTEIHN